MKRTVCELFAGVGGFRLGFERESKEWNTVWFSQWEPGAAKQWAHACYVNHFGTAPEETPETNADIATVRKEDIPDHNLLVGGFPCQDYSVARPLPGARGIEGKKGVLWWQIRDTLIAKRASFVLLENVDRLLRSPATQRGRDFGVILSCLNALDYSVEWRVVNAADYGAVQRRRRTFIFAYSNRTAYAGCVESNDIPALFSHCGFFARSFPVGKIDSAKIREGLIGTDVPEVSANFRFDFDGAGYMSKGRIFTTRTTPRYSGKRLLLRDIMDHGVDEKYYLGEALEKWTFLKGAKRIKRKSKNGHEYLFSEGAIAFPDPVDLPARTMLTSEGTLNRSTHVVEDLETGRKRKLTPDEADRIQGFDSGWTALGGMPERMRYFCMGNALVVPMITRMAKTLGKILDEEP